MNGVRVEKSFCTTRQAAKLLGVSVGTVQLWVESGLLVAWKTAGGHRRVMRDSVERLLRKPSSPHSETSGHIAVAAEITPADRRLSVLVVEDDLALLRLYELKVSTWPMRPAFTGIDNAFSALLLMGRNPPDLLITDLQMPGMDGFEMLRAVTKVPELVNTTIVVVSGLDKADVSAKGGIPAGMELLGKPIPFDRLQAIAEQIADQKKLRRLGNAT